MANHPNGKRGEKKSEMLEFRLSWSEKQAFKARCDADNVAVSARLRDLIKADLDHQAEPASTPQERSLPMNGYFKRRPRALVATLLAAGSTAALVSAAPSAANIDTRVAFERIDADQDGRVTYDEFEDFITREGFFMTPSTPVDTPVRLAEEAEILGSIRSEFARYDRNRDGVMEHGEFATRYVWRMETSFNAIDRNYDGFIETRELARVMGGIGLSGRVSQNTRLDRAGEAIEALDANGDGRLDFNEFSTGS